MTQAIIQTTEQKCKASIEHFKKELQRMRTGRASASLLEGIHAEYYGSSVPLIQLGLINAPEPRMITVQVYDISAAEAVDKAIRQSELGLNPQREGNLIRVNIPALTEERRKEFVKKVKGQAEDTKVQIRNARREGVDIVKDNQKKSIVTEDESRKLQEQIQKVIDKYIADVDVLLVEKEKEILAV